MLASARREIAVLCHMPRRPSRPSRTESGQAALEFAVVLPLFLMLIFAAISFSIYWYQQAAAAIASSSAARRGGIENSTGVAQSEFAEMLSILSASELAGSSSIAVDPQRRSVIVRTNTRFSGSYVPFLGDLDLAIRSASMSRLWRFYPGPPDPWE